MRQGQRVSRGGRPGRCKDQLQALREFAREAAIVCQRFLHARLTGGKDLLRQGGALRYPSLLNWRWVQKMKPAFPASASLTLTIITDNYYDALRPDPPMGKRFRVFPGASIHAEHGFSCHLETVSKGSSSS